MIEHDTRYCGAFATAALESLADLDTELSLSVSMSVPSLEDSDEDWVDLATESAGLLWKLRSRLLQSECCDQGSCVLFGWILIQRELQWQEEITEVDVFLDAQQENYPGRYFARTLDWE